VQVSGLAILAVGVQMKVKLHVYVELTTVYYDAAPYILIGVGCAIVLVGFLGCLCTVKGFPALLYIVSSTLSRTPLLVVEPERVGGPCKQRSAAECLKYFTTKGRFSRATRT